jgi:hypothetical protein
VEDRGSGCAVDKASFVTGIAVPVDGGTLVQDN